MPPLLFGRQSGNRNAQALLMQSLLIPTFAAKQHGRNFASQRPAEILLSANHCTINQRKCNQKKGAEDAFFWKMCYTGLSFSGGETPPGCEVLLCRTILILPPRSGESDI